MRKYSWIVVVMLIGCIVAFASCRRMEQMIAPVMPDAEMIEPPPETVETPAEPEVAPESASTKLTVVASAELKDPNNDGGDEWVNLKRYAPDLLPTLSSTEVFGGPAHLETTIIFVNCTETEISSYWLDHDRNEVLYGKIPPGEACWQHSWEGHVWIVKDAAENNIALFIAQDEIGRALLMDPGTPVPEPPTEMVETPPETMVEMEPAETTETPMEPAETTDLHGGMVDIEDAMSTVGLRKIYGLSGYDLLRVNADGSGLETIIDSYDYFSLRSSNLVVDSEGGKIYWNNSDDSDDGGGMWRSNLDGTNVERLVTTPVRNFTLDLEAGKIYYIASQEDRNIDTDHLFQRSNLDGSGVEKFRTPAIAALLGYVNGIAFDPINRKIYAHNYNDLFVINADDLDIKFADIEFEFQFYQVDNFALDIDDRKIYYAKDGEIFRVNLDGTNREQLVDAYNIAGTYDIAVTFDFNTRKIYWANQEVSSGGRRIVWQTNFDGSGTAALFAIGVDIDALAVETGLIN